MEKGEKHNARELLPPHRLSKRFIDHGNSPRNFGRLAVANGTARGVGTCGDSIEIFLKVNDQRIKEIKHVPNGCVYTVACASATTELVRGRRLEEALKITPEDVARALGGLPEDHRHCAALAVNTLGEAIDDYYQRFWDDLRRR